MAEPSPSLSARLSAFVTPVRASLAIAIAAGLFCGASLQHYGITSDSPSLFYSGERHLFWLGHLGQPGALDLASTDHEPAGFHAEFQRFPDINDPVHYPVFPGFVAAVTSWLVHTRLGWLNQIDGHHLGLVLLQSVLLFLFGLWACRLLGRGAGIIATLTVALYPTVIGHAPNNAKDLPCAMLYGLALMATGVGVIEEKWKHLVAAGVFVGFGLAAKLNAAFVFPTVLLWSPLAWLALHRRQKPIQRSVLTAWLCAPVIAFVVFFVTWPWLWYGGPRDWYAHLHEYVRFMGSFGASGRNLPTLFPIKALLFMTPPLALAAGLLYLALGWRGSRADLSRWSLLSLWLLLPIARIAAPHSNFYDANRHFLEYAPAICAMAGAGAMLLFDHVGRRLTPLGLGAAALIGVGSLVWPVASYHPYETTYFNFLIGGLGGAQQKALFQIGPPQDIRVNGTEGDYWFSSARDGFRELRTLNPQNAPVAICGPGRGHALFNVIDDPRFTFIEVQEKGFDAAPLLYASPRETLCWWRQVRRWESERPVVMRVERGGGLVWEILGPKDGQKHTPPSPRTQYEESPDPRDRDGLIWKQDPTSRSGLASP